MAQSTLTSWDVFFAVLFVFVIGAVGGFCGWHLAQFLFNHISLSFDWR